MKMKKQGFWAKLGAKLLREFLQGAKGGLGGGGENYSVKQSLRDRNRTEQFLATRRDFNRRNK